MEINNLQFNSISTYKRLSKPAPSKKTGSSERARQIPIRWNSTSGVRSRLHRQVPRHGQTLPQARKDLPRSHRSTRATTVPFPQKP